MNNLTKDTAVRELLNYRLKSLDYKKVITSLKDACTLIDARLYGLDNSKFTDSQKFAICVIRDNYAGFSDLVNACYGEGNVNNLSIDFKPIDILHF